MLHVSLNILLLLDKTQVFVLLQIMKELLPLPNLFSIPYSHSDL